MIRYLFLLIFLSGCAVQTDTQGIDTSVLDCRDPETRRRLGPGDTYRDLARAHADAVEGWQDCKSATDAAKRIYTNFTVHPSDINL